jgi:hypothetical protein
MGRVLRRLGSAAVGLAALYLVGMNLFLRTRAFRNLVNGSPEEIAIEYATGYSILPGRIHVERLSIRGRDHHVEWILRLDRCDFSVSLLELSRRRFHASRVRGDGLSLRIRLRVNTTATPEHDAALPPIPGFADPPRKDPGPPPPPLSDAQYNLWSAQLDDVDVEHVRELWIDTLRMTGDLRVRGRWLFRPVRWLDVGPATVDVAKLDLSYGAHEPIATGISGALRATVHPFDVRVPEGREVLKFVSVDTGLQGHLYTADALGLVLATTGASFRFVRGEGPFDARLILDHGVIAVPSHVQHKVEVGELGVAGVSVRAAIDAELSAQLDDVGQPSATLLLRATGLDASREDGAQASVASAEAYLTSHQLDLSRPAPDDVTFVSDFAGLRTSSLRPWIPRGGALDVHSGQATASGHLHGSLSDERGSGDMSFSVQSLSATDGAARLEQGRAQGTLVLDDVSLRETRLELGESRLEVADAVAHVQDLDLRARRLELALQAASYGWTSGELDLTRLTVDLRGAALIVVHDSKASLRVEAPAVALRSARMHLDQAGPAGSFSVDIRRAEAHDLRPAGALLRLPKNLTIDGGRGSLSLRADVDLPARTVAADGELIARDLAVHAGSRSLSGILKIALHARRRGTTTVLSGTSIAFDSTASAADDPSASWWARADLVDGELSSGGLHFRGKVHLTAKDASPLVAMVGADTAVPLWIAKDVPMHGLEADSELRMSPNRFELRSLTARGGSDLVELEYAHQKAAPASTEWALLVEAGPIHAAFRGGDLGTKLVLFGARPWFDRMASSVRARESTIW